MRKLLLGFAIGLLGVAIALPDAEARRLGGGRSIGTQRSVTQTKPVAPPARDATAARNATASQGAAVKAPARASWMPVLGGLTAGGLLGALFGGNALFGFLMVVLAVAIVVFVARLVMRTRSEGPAVAQFAGLGRETVAAPPPSQLAEANDAAPVAQGPQAPQGLPDGFDLQGFLRTAKLNFVRLQIANDLGKLDEIREFSTAEMYAILSKDVAARGGAAQQTDVVSLNAELAELVSEGETHRASVRFSGKVRETPASAPTGFAELWHLVKPADGSTGWLLAGIQQAG